MLMTALEVVKLEANAQTDTRYVVEKASGDIEIGTNIGAKGDNEEMSEDIIRKLEEAGYSFKVSWISAVRIDLEKL